MYILLAIILYIKRNSIMAWLRKKYGYNCLPTNMKFFIYTAIAGFIFGLMYVFSELKEGDNYSDTLTAAILIIYAVGAAIYVIRGYKESRGTENRRETLCRHWLTAGLSLFILIVAMSVTIWALVLVIVVLMIGFIDKATGFFPGVSSSAAPTPPPSCPGAISGPSDNPYTPMMDPTGSDDGGIMDGNTRVPLHDNGDGTMSDDRGGLYKRDGNDVRKL